MILNSQVQELNIQVKEVSEGWLAFLETKSVIKRLMPGQHQLKTEKGTSKYDTLYASDDKFGPHKLICVTINNHQLEKMVYHNAPEEFILLDTEEATPLILVVALITYEKLYDKINQGTLTAGDFMALKMLPNHPYFSFFTMMPGFAHAEICTHTSDNPPSFYVTESRDIDEIKIDFKTYHLNIERGHYEKIRD